MNSIGFIGFGSMGSMLVKGFVESGQVPREQIIVTRKNKSRLDEMFEQMMNKRKSVNENVCKVFEA